jgi:hypothetical protein
MKSINAFLSHKYDASDVNAFFFGLFSGLAEVQFEVDEGKTSTNVTRLERMIRNSDAFIGIYPSGPADVAHPSIESLRAGSEYFRLELDLATRAQKPGLIFIDSRYGNVLSAPASLSYETFSIAEILAPGGKPSTPRFEQAASGFFDRVFKAKEFGLSEHRFEHVNNEIGILVPCNDSSESYGKEDIEFLRDRISDAGFDSEVLAWPAVLTPRLVGKMRAFDWMVADIGPASMSTGIIGYLHGAFVPTMRLLRVDAPSSMDTPSTLYAGVNVGYRKDILRWTNSEMLRNEFMKRLNSLNFGTRRLSTPAEANSYFLEATRRKETVFVSYAGEDEAESEDLRDALRKRFQQVFDYRDGRSIRAGKHWISEIFDQLGRSAVGIPLLSSNSVASLNCQHELEQMIALADDGKMQVYPIKLRRGDDFKAPSVIQATQYARSWEYKTAGELVEWIIGNFPAKAAASANG